MRQAHTYRAARKATARLHDADLQEFPNKLGVGARMDWLRKHPKLAPFYTAALAALSTGPRATPPKWRAIRKLMVALAISPRVKPIGFKQAIPAMAMLDRHQRGSWRDLPHVTIDANLQVAS